LAMSKDKPSLYQTLCRSTCIQFHQQPFRVGLWLNSERMEGLSNGLSFRRIGMMEGLQGHDLDSTC
jgi:hypothetical protein